MIDGIVNDTKKYWDQYRDVTDIPETPQNDKLRTCGVSCAGMFTAVHPDVILQEMFEKYGINDKFKWEKHLIEYLKTNGHTCNPIMKNIHPKRYITEKELAKMRAEIDKGNVIFYHKAGHYQIMVGYLNNGACYVFNDPAGDRTIGRSKRRKKSGHNVIYPREFIVLEKIKGRCWSVTV